MAALRTVLCLLLVAGCGREDAAVAPGSPLAPQVTVTPHADVAPEPMVTVVSGTPDRPSEATTAEAEGGAAEPEPEPEPSRTDPELRDFGQEEAEALAEEVLEEELEGHTVCGQMFELAQRTVRAMASRERGRYRLASPDRRSFMRGCAALPPDIQRCMNPAFNRTHERSCRRALRTAVMDPTGRERHRVLSEDVEREAGEREAAEVEEEPTAPTRLGPDAPEPVPGDGDTAAGG